MINIPDNEHGATTIRIEGNKDGVAKAKKVRRNVDFLPRAPQNDDQSICYLMHRETKNNHINTDNEAVSFRCLNPRPATITVSTIICL